eukprot:7382291-Prymnesium_polylepis.1
MTGGSDHASTFWRHLALSSALVRISDSATSNQRMLKMPLRHRNQRILQGTIRLWKRDLQRGVRHRQAFRAAHNWLGKRRQAAQFASWYARFKVLAQFREWLGIGEEHESMVGKRRAFLRWKRVPMQADGVQPMVDHLGNLLACQRPFALLRWHAVVHGRVALGSGCLTRPPETECGSVVSDDNASGQGPRSA